MVGPNDYFGQITQKSLETTNTIIVIFLNSVIIVVTPLSGGRIPILQAQDHQVKLLLLLLPCKSVERLQNGAFTTQPVSAQNNY